MNALTKARYGDDRAGVAAGMLTPIIVAMLCTLGPILFYAAGSSRGTDAPRKASHATSARR